VSAATRILQRFGVSVAGTFDTEFDRDVLRFTVNPSDEIQYDQIVNSPTQGTTCWVTTSFRDFVEFTNFDMSTGNPISRLRRKAGSP